MAATTSSGRPGAPILRTSSTSSGAFSARASQHVLRHRAFADEGLATQARQIVAILERMKSRGSASFFAIPNSADT